MMRKFKRMMIIKLARMVRGEKSIVPCILSVGTKFKGDILDGDIVQIDGKLEGNVACKELIVGNGGKVFGQVNAKSVELYGELEGSIHAESLFIASSAKFVGDSVYQTIAIEPGAVLIGKCTNSSVEQSAIDNTKDKKDSGLKLAA